LNSQLHNRVCYTCQLKDIADLDLFYLTKLFIMHGCSIFTMCLSDLFGGSNDESDSSDNDDYDGT